MALSKEQFLGFRPQLTPVEVPELGGTIYLRIMSGTERDSFEAEAFRLNGKNVEINRENFRARLLVRTLCGEDGVRWFRDDELDAVGALSSTVTVPLADKASQINGISKADQEAIAKNS